MPRLVPPIPGLTYTLVDDTGLVLTDPSGIIASWSVVNGVLEVVTNAATGIAYLLRTIAPVTPDAMHVTNVRVQRRIQSTTRINIAWGVGGDPAVDPLEFNGAGIGLEPFANDDRPICWTSNVVRFAEPTNQSLYIKGLISVGAPTGNGSTTQAAVACGGVRNAGGESAAHRSTTDLSYPLAVEGFVINNEQATAQTVSAEFATNVESKDYLTPGNTASPTPPLSKLNPIGPLTLSAGWTLSDPSGIIATAPVSDGSTVTVGFNAIAGVAYLTRPLTNADTDAVLVVTSMQRLALPVTMTGDWEYGIGTVDGALHSTSGMSTNPTGVASRIRRNGATVGNGAGSGHDGIIGSFMMMSTDAVSDGVARWTGLTTGIARSGASGNLNRANGPQFTEVGSRYEVIRMETNGLAAETMSWTFLSGIASFAYLPVGP